MNETITAGRWKQLIGQVTTRWGQLTDSDWTNLSGQVETFVGKLQERYGLAREQALAAVDDICAETASIAAGLDADKRADERMDADFGSSPRPGMDNLAATPVNAPAPYAELIDAAMRFGRGIGDQVKQHPGVAIAAAATIGFLAARLAARR